MARIRSIKPTFFSSLTVTSLPKATRLTFVGLWCYVDDAGRGIDDPRLVKAEVWPLDNDQSPSKVEGDLKRLASSGLIERYSVAGRRYLRVTNWTEHQKINRPQQSRFPAPGGVNAHGARADDSVNAHGASDEASLPEGKGREGKGDLLTSSSELTTGDDSPDDDDPKQPPRIVRQAIAILVDRDLADRQTAASQPPVADPAAWTKTAYQRRLANSWPLAKLADDHPDWTAEQLADFAEPRPAAASNGARPDPRATVLDGQQRAERVRAEEHMQRLAEERRNPIETDGSGPKRARAALRSERPPSDA